MELLWRDCFGKLHNSQKDCVCAEKEYYRRELVLANARVQAKSYYGVRSSARAYEAARSKTLEDVVKERPSLSRRKCRMLLWEERAETLRKLKAEIAAYRELKKMFRVKLEEFREYKRKIRFLITSEMFKTIFSGC